MDNAIYAQSSNYQDFGKYLSFQDAIKSSTAIRLGITNLPTPGQYKNMIRVYQDFYIPICQQFGRLPVSSFFRSARLNKVVGGSKTSAHMDGLAIDIDCDGLGNPTNKELYQWIRGHLRYDQVITEFPDAAGNPGWVHVAHRANGYDRQQGMRAEKRGNSVVYIYE